MQNLVLLEISNFYIIFPENILIKKLIPKIIPREEKFVVSITT